VAADVLSLRGVEKGFPEGDRWHAVLDGLDLDVASGEFLCVTGRSGNGKSTLLNILGGIDTPDRGEVLYQQRDLAALSERERTLHRRRNIGFVFQFFNLVPGLTVRENLRLALELNGRRDDDRIDTLLEHLGMLSRAGSWPEVLSGGEQQRVAIARALVHQPGIVLADEPTGNLDADNAETVMQSLVQACRGEHATLVVVTHSDELVRSADRQLELRQGRLHPV
jgi:putative ABC transport system ATP-binding protein